MILKLKPELTTFKEWLEYIKMLPYGRSSKREDLSLVVKEGCGSCSSKHAVLKLVADELHVPDVELVMSIYLMNGKNTPKIKPVLTKYKLDHLPEAHCYLKIHEERLDVTFANSDYKNIANDVQFEEIIEPKQVIEYKPSFHRSYFKDWVELNDFKYSFEELWKIREECILALSN